jgi:cellulose synthase/poly-beta-1,6-N-acetylglucosamine synthase-like glycosyltransferase
MISLFFVISSLALGYLSSCCGSAGLRQLEKSVSHSPREESSKTRPNALLTVALIVCVRNEERRLPRLLHALAQQHYPKEKLEICLVDDRSTDRTGKIIAAFAASHANAVHLRIDDTVPDFAPKKHAIDTAIHCTKGEIILLTDADSTPGPWWLHKMASAFTPAVVMVVGYSPYFPRRTLWQKAMALEYFSQAAVAAGGCGADRPLTCVGSNLAYRREAYWRIGGFSEIAHWISGDDDLLLHKMRRAGIGKIHYAASPLHAPSVHPPSSWQEFKAHGRGTPRRACITSPLTIPLILVYLLNLLLCAGMLSLVLGWWTFFEPVLALGILKAAGEYSYLRRAAKIFAEQQLLSLFPLVALAHPFYIVFFATRAQLTKFSWRGERFAPKKSSTL